MQAEEIYAKIEEAQSMLLNALGSLESLLESFPDSRLMSNDEDRLYDEIVKEKNNISLTDDRLGDIKKNVKPTPYVEGVYFKP